MKWYAKWRNFHAHTATGPLITRELWEDVKLFAILILAFDCAQNNFFFFIYTLFHFARIKIGRFHNLWVSYFVGIGTLCAGLTYQRRQLLLIDFIHSKWFECSSSKCIATTAQRTRNEPKLNRMIEETINSHFVRFILPRPRSIQRRHKKNVECIYWP